MVTGRDERIPDTVRAVCKEVKLSTGPEVDKNTNKDIRRFFETRFVNLETIWVLNYEEDGFWIDLLPALRVFSYG